MQILSLTQALGINVNVKFGRNSQGREGKGKGMQPYRNCVIVTPKVCGRTTKSTQGNAGWPRSMCLDRDATVEAFGCMIDFFGLGSGQTTDGMRSRGFLEKQGNKVTRQHKLTGIKLTGLAVEVRTDERVKVLYSSSVGCDVGSSRNILHPYRTYYYS